MFSSLAAYVTVLVDLFHNFISFLYDRSSKAKCIFDIALILLLYNPVENSQVNILPSFLIYPLGTPVEHVKSHLAKLSSNNYKIKYTSRAGSWNTSSLLVMPAV